MMRIKDMLQLRAAGAVKRCHTARTRGQSVAEHSWGVAMLLLAVYPIASRAALEYALTHDLPELFTGDTPANAKWAAPALESALREMEAKFIERFDLVPKTSLTDHERDVVKFCDGAELMLHCLEELYQGNRYASEMLWRIAEAMAKRGIPYCCEDTMDYLMSLASEFRQGPPGNVELYERL